MSCLHCYIVRHARKPNFPFSMQTCVSNTHSLRLASFLSCSIPFSVLMQGTNMDEETPISSQFTVIRSPSGFRSSIFSAFCSIYNLIEPFKFYLQHVLRRHVKVCTLGQPFLNPLGVPLLFEFVHQRGVIYLLICAPLPKGLDP